MTIPGLFYEKLNKESSCYTQKEQHLVQEVEQRQEGNKIEQKIKHEPRIWFLNPEKNRVVQLGDHLISVSVLKPYKSWEADYRPRLEHVLRALMEIVKPDRLLRIGLRYVNFIEVAEKEAARLEDLFAFRPFLGEVLPQEPGPFFLGHIFSFPRQRAQCNVQIANGQAETRDSLAFVLDLDFYTMPTESVPVADALQWAESAHAEVENLFEGCITDRLRALFQKDG
jgi:uncharacterized protein (TIGR04255 family)